MTKVGDVTGPRTPTPSPMPWVSVVLPAPSPPVSTTRSPAAQQRARGRDPAPGCRRRREATTRRPLTRRPRGAPRPARARATLRFFAMSWTVRRTRGLLLTGTPSATARCARAMSMSSCWVTSCGCSSMRMWPASSTTTCSAPGMRRTISSLCEGGVMRSPAPFMTRVSMPMSGARSSLMSSASMSGRKAAMTSKDVEKIISPTRWTRSALTGESNAQRWTRRPAPRGPSCAAPRSARRAATAG